VASMTPTDPVISVLYSSSAREPMDDAGLGDLLRQSRESNSRAGITGMLMYRAGRFFQVLEGPEGEVRPLLERIARDPRHERMRVLLEEPVERRRFTEWTMGYEPVALFDEELPEGFRNTFDDLEQEGDPSAVMRAARELTMWFRVRSNRPATD
jgi:hypothetical protein